jgi:hypothetical protein
MWEKTVFIIGCPGGYNLILKWVIVSCTERRLRSKVKFWIHCNKVVGDFIKHCNSVLSA